MGDLFRRTALTIQRVFNQHDPAARAVDEALADGLFAPVFVLSPPRTGSTIVYQALVAELGLAYVSNVMALLPRFMVRLQKASRRLAPGYQVPLHPGDYGFVPGLLAPSEAGKVTDRWFDPTAVDRNAASVRRMAVALAETAGAPLIVKNPSLVLKLDAVIAIFPRSRFVVLTRSPVYAAQSMLIGRLNLSISADRWAGVEPPGFHENPDRDLEFRIVRQYAELANRIDEAMRTQSADRVARLSYESFCADPANAVCKAADQLGLAYRRGASKLPARFVSQDKCRVEPERMKRIELACRELGMDPMAG